MVAAQLGQRVESKDQLASVLFPHAVENSARVARVIHLKHFRFTAVVTVRQPVLRSRARRQVLSKKIAPPPPGEGDAGAGARLTTVGQRTSLTQLPSGTRAMVLALASGMCMYMCL